MTTPGPHNVLFLCTGNSARSIIAEAILNGIDQSRFVAYSAGSQPKGQVHPETLNLLNDLGFHTGSLRSKSWNEFAGQTDVAFDHVITVCNNAAGEACPVIPGNAAKEHWDIPDPAAVVGSSDEIRAAFGEAYRMLRKKIEAFVANTP